MGENPAPRWKRRPEERPSQILDAALEVFESRGLAGARLEEIAEEAGISKGTIYLYFESKEALFRALVQRTIVAVPAEFADRERGGTATARLHELAAEVWGHYRSREFQTVYRLVFGELHRFPELAKACLVQVPSGTLDCLARIIEEGTSGGEFGQVAPRSSARMILALLLTHAVWCERRALFPMLARRTDDEIFAEIMEFCRQALGSRSTGVEPQRPSPPAAAHRRRAGC